MKIVGYLDEEDIQVKEAAGGIISNLALSSSSHGALVEVGVIPKLVSCRIPMQIITYLCLALMLKTWNAVLNLKSC